MTLFRLIRFAARGPAMALALTLASSPLLVAAGQNPPAPRVPPRPRTLAELKAALRLMPPPGRPPDDADALLTPPRQPPRSTAWGELAETTKAMTEYLQHGPAGNPASPFARLVRQSTKFAQAALADLMQVETDFPGALENLRQSVGHLTSASQGVAPGSAERRFTNGILSRLARTGLRLGSDGILRAQTAGLEDERLPWAQTALRAAGEHVLAGQYVLAFDQLGPAIIVGNLPHFRLDLYEANIRDAFEGQVVGYQYAIAKNGLLVATHQDGVARTGADLPATAQSATKEMNIASVSKTITATVLVQLLDDLSIPVDSSIEPYLPASWDRGPGIDDLSFRSLLIHESGLDDNRNRDYRLADLESYIAAGVEGVNDDGVPYQDLFQYQNANFALFRVAIPYLLYGEDDIQELYADFPFTFEDLISWLYVDAVRTYALDLTGFVDADCQADDPTPTLRYAFPDDGSPGAEAGDWRTRCGSGGWFMSSVELVGFMAYRRFTNLIMSPTARGRMDTGFLGWNDPNDWSWGSGLYGTYRSHGGDLTNLDACIMEYPNGIQTALLINSGGGSYAYQCQELTDAYDNAFIIP